MAESELRQARKASENEVPGALDLAGVIKIRVVHRISVFRSSARVRVGARRASSTPELGVAAAMRLAYAQGPPNHPEVQTMKLYHMPGTRSARVLWTAHEVGAADEVQVVPLNLQKGEGQSPEHKARHPHGKVPAAEIQGVKLIESGAIALHLALRHKPSSSFLPDLATLPGAKVLQWAFYAVSTLDDLTIDAFLQRFAPENQRDNALVERAGSRWKEIITPFLSHELGKGPFLLGQDFTFADVMVGYTAFYAGEMGLLDDSLKAYVGRISERPGFKKAFGR